MKKYYCFAPLVVLFLCVIGCGQKAPYPVVPIEGVVTWEGKPIPKEFVLKFRPESGMTESTGFIKDGGKFVTVHTVDIDGVPTGNCTVRVQWNGGDGTSPPDEYKPLVSKYGFTTEGFPVEIKKKDKNMKLDFPAVN
jgi:hypothetical protein